MPPENVSIHAECSIMRNIMASDTEAEVGKLFNFFRRPTQYEPTYNKQDTHNHPAQWEQKTMK